MKNRKQIICFFLIFFVSILVGEASNYSSFTSYNKTPEFYWSDIINNLDYIDEITLLSKIKRFKQVYPGKDSLGKISFMEGIIYKRRKESKNMIRSFKNSLKYKDFLADYSAYYLTKYYYKRKKYKQAQKYAKILVAKYPNSLMKTEAIKLLSKIAYLKGKYKQNLNYLSELYAYTLENKYIIYKGDINYKKLKKYKSALDNYLLILDVKDKNIPKSLLISTLKRISYIVLYKKVRLSSSEKKTILKKVIKIFVENKNYRSALKTLKKMSYSAEKFYYLGYVNFKLGNLEKATNYFKYVNKKYPESKLIIQSKFYRAKANLFLGYKKFALKNLLEFIKEYPYHDLTDNAYFLLAKYYDDTNYKEKSLKLLKKIRLSYPNNDTYDDALWYEFDILYRKKDYSGAIKVLSTFLNITSDKKEYVKALYWRGKVKQKNNDLLSAAKDYIDLIRHYPMEYYTFRSINLLQVLYPKLQKFVSSPSYSFYTNKFDYENVLKEMEYCLNGKNKTNYVQMLKKDYREFDYKDVEFEIFPTTNFRNHFFKYFILYKMKVYKNAVKELEYVYKSKQNDPKYIYNLASIYTELGNLRSAINLVESLVKKFGSNFDLSSMPAKLKKILYPCSYRDTIKLNAYRNNVDPYLIFAIVREESRFNPRCVSGAGAIGVMQIMPYTGRWIARQMGFGRFNRWKLFDSIVNIKMGTWYFSFLKQKYSNNLLLALASYNGGARNVERWLKSFKRNDIDEFVENIPFKETKNYVKKVLRSYNIYKLVYDKGYSYELSSTDNFNSTNKLINY